MARACAAAVCLAAAAAPAAASFRVQFNVSTEDGDGSFTVRVEEDWAPIGAERFRELIEAEFYDDTRFFRVIPTFMVQFGLNGDPAQNEKWQGINDESKDTKTESNKPGYVTFAKTGAPNSRTTQIFINYVDNARLDSMGFAPFGMVEGDGMDVVKKIYNCGEKPDQGSIKSQGSAYLSKEFPNLSYVKTARMLASCTAETPEHCTEKEKKYVETWKDKSQDDVVKQIKRLEGMMGGKMKAEVKQWVRQRKAILKTMSKIAADAAKKDEL